MILIDDENKKAVEELQKLKQTGEFKTLIIFWGVGVGKTFLVKNIFNNFDYFIDEPEFKQQIVSGGARLRNPDEWGAWLKTFPLEALAKFWNVIYDDYGTADLSPAYIEKMLYWINRRIDKGLKTIITTNLTFKQFEEREKRIASRLMENGVLMEMSGKDRRKKETKIIKA
jgi:DNA replication protein DnaC